MIMLIARKALNALQRRGSLLNSLNCLCWPLQQVIPDGHACSAVRSPQAQAGSHQVACVGSSNTDFEPPPALKLLNSRRTYSTFAESVTCFSQHAFNSTPRRLSAAGRP